MLHKSIQDSEDGPLEQTISGHLLSWHQNSTDIKQFLKPFIFKLKQVLSDSGRYFYSHFQLGSLAFTLL